MTSKPNSTSRIFRTLVFVLAALIVLDGARAAQWLGLAPAEARPAAQRLVELLAPLLFLVSLWLTGRVIARIEQGERFSPSLAMQINWIGAGLMLGGWAAILFQPAMLYLIENGFTHLSGVTLDWSVQNLVLCLLGFLMLSLSRKGSALQKALDGFV
jgi:hypothetical protein